MAAPTTAYNATGNAGEVNAHIVAPAYRVKKTVANGETLTISLLNATELFKVRATVDVDVGVHASGMTNQVSPVNGNLLWETFPEQTTKILVKNSSGASGTVWVYAVLSPVNTFPELSEANGFDGVQSNSSAVVA